VCVSECPVDAIVSAEDIVDSQRPFIELNASLSKQWPAITCRQPPLPDAEEWRAVHDKLQHLRTEALAS
jgi:ferredoxin